MATRVVLFDIDGTLVLTGGAGIRAMTQAFHELFAIPDAFTGIQMAGRTDAGILADAALTHGLSGRDLSQFPVVYLRHLQTQIALPGPRKGLMPGVRPLLDAVTARRDLFPALLTGNYEAAARVKLEYFDVWRYFQCGAFGDHATDRNVLVPAALTRICGIGGPDVHPSDVVVIGDTPRDVECAAVAGARSIAVATGPFDEETLRAAGAHVVFRDLSDTPAVLRALDL